MLLFWTTWRQRKVYEIRLRHAIQMNKWRISWGCLLRFPQIQSRTKPKWVRQQQPQLHEIETGNWHVNSNCQNEDCSRIPEKGKHVPMQCDWTKSFVVVFLEPKFGIASGSFCVKMKISLQAISNILLLCRASCLTERVTKTRDRKYSYQAQRERERQTERPVRVVQVLPLNSKKQYQVKSLELGKFWIKHAE